MCNVRKQDGHDCKLCSRLLFNNAMHHSPEAWTSASTLLVVGLIESNAFCRRFSSQIDRCTVSRSSTRVKLHAQHKDGHPSKEREKARQASHDRHAIANMDNGKTNSDHLFCSI